MASGYPGSVKNVLGALLPLLLYVAGLWLVVGNRILRDTGGDWSLAIPVFWGLLWPALLLLSAIYIVIGVFASMGRRRNERLRESRRAVATASGVRTQTFVRALIDSGVRTKYGTSPSDFSYGLSVVVRRKGIEVWGGGFRDPSHYLTIRRESLVKVEIGQTLDGFRVSRCLLLTVGRDEGATTTIPLVIVGGGLGGLFPMAISGLSRLSKEIEQAILDDAGAGDQ